MDTITVPTEVILWRFTPSGTRSKCLSVKAGMIPYNLIHSFINLHTGGDLTAFTVEREGDKTRGMIDLLICGNGQYGGLGNNTYTTVQGNPSRVKSLSALFQCTSCVLSEFEIEREPFSQIANGLRTLSQLSLRKCPFLPLDMSF